MLQTYEAVFDDLLSEIINANDIGVEASSSCPR
jgi:hypothetical protein